MKSRQFRLLLLIFWLILAGLIVWFKVLPLGSATYYLKYPAKFNLFDGKGFIGRFTPVDRVEIGDTGLAKIVGDPVYFSIFTPRTFSEAKITVTYKNNLTSSTPIIEAGVLVDNIVWRYKLATLENKLLDDSFSSWNRLESDGLVLLQKNKKFSELEDFLNTLKDQPETICTNGNITKCLALYNIDSSESYLPKTILPKNIIDFSPINIPLQGAHQFYFIAPAKQDLNFDFDFVDLNLNKDKDPIVVSLYKQGVKVYSTTINDNFGDENTGKVRNFFVPLVYSVASLESGLYKLEIKAGDDVIIKKISRAPSALWAISKVRPVNASSLPLSFWTSSSFIKVTTNNPASRQILSFGDLKFDLVEAYQQFEFENSTPGLKEINLKHDDVILETDGIFSFSSIDFFNPEFKKLDRHFLSTGDTEYVLAKYKAPQKIKNDFKVATFILNTKEAYREQGKYGFMISVPGLSLTDEGSLEIKEIKVEFSGRTIWDKIKEKLLTYVN
jgi:hypothetical protein